MCKSNRNGNNANISFFSKGILLTFAYASVSVTIPFLEKIKSIWSTKRIKQPLLIYIYIFLEKTANRFWSFLMLQTPTQGYDVLVSSASGAPGRERGGQKLQERQCSRCCRIHRLLLWSVNYSSNRWRTKKRFRQPEFIHHLLQGSGGKPPAGTWTAEEQRGECADEQDRSTSCVCLTAKKALIWSWASCISNFPWRYRRPEWSGTTEVCLGQTKRWAK